MPPADIRGRDYDLIVVGAGLIGAAAALGAARRGWQVLLVEPAKPQLHRGSLDVDLRNVAVSPASRALLDDLGVWAALPAAAYRRMEVWEERGTRAMTFDAAEVARTELGWIVENSPAVTTLWQAIERHERIHVRLTRVTAVKPGAERVDVVLEDGAAAGRLLIAADGAASPVRGGLGVAVRTMEVGHVALATVVRTARPHDGVAYQRFLLEGPLALLPSTHPRQSSVVWSQPPEAANRRRELGERAFCAELERCLQSRLGEVEAVDQRMAFPLKQQLAHTFNPHPRVLLVGDAARVLHPLAGLGGNLGFEDVRGVLAVLDGLSARGDPGTDHLWRAFDRQRQARSELMLRVMDGLRLLYARGDPVSQLLRNAGVGWLNAAGPVKRQIMVEAMGLGPVGRGSVADLAG